MKILLLGSTGGIGSAIQKMLSEHEIVETIQAVDWAICAQGFIGEDDIEQTFIANTILCIRLTQEVLPKLKYGIIYISSTAGIGGNSTYPVYAASKAAINSYVLSMAKKDTEHSFYALCPGPTNTKMWKSLKLTGEAQDPKEVAKAVKQIMEGAFTSGDIITVRNGKVSV